MRALSWVSFLAAVYLFFRAAYILEEEAEGDLFSIEGYLYLGAAALLAMLAFWLNPQWMRALERLGWK
jgi:hypothetical protein